MTMTDRFDQTIMVGDYVFAPRQNQYGGGNVCKVLSIDKTNVKLEKIEGRTVFDGQHFFKSKTKHKYWKSAYDLIKAPHGWVPPHESN